MGWQSLGVPASQNWGLLGGFGTAGHGGQGRRPPCGAASPPGFGGVGGERGAGASPARKIFEARPAAAPGRPDPRCQPCAALAGAAGGQGGILLLGDLGAGRAPAQHLPPGLCAPGPIPADGRTKISPGRAAGGGAGGEPPATLTPPRASPLGAVSLSVPWGWECSRSPPGCRR